MSGREEVSKRERQEKEKEGETCKHTMLWNIYQGIVCGKISLLSSIKGFFFLNCNR
jgi:hypothetical protein